MKLEQILNLNVGDLFKHHVVKKVMPPEVISPDRDWKIIFYLFIISNIVIFFCAGYLLTVVIGGDTTNAYNSTDSVPNNIDSVKIKNLIDYYDNKRNDSINKAVSDLHIPDPSI